MDLVPAQGSVLDKAVILLTDWPGLPPDTQTERLELLLQDMAVLTPGQRGMALQILVKAGIISTNQAVETLNDLAISADISYSASFAGLIDIVDSAGLPAFLVHPAPERYRVKENDTLSILRYVNKDGKILVPPPKTQIPWLLPKAEEVYRWSERDKKLGDQKADSQLYDDLLSYFKDISELPSEAHYDLIIAWVFHTYLLESFQHSPIICLFAVPERGKTRTGQGMIYVAYRGIHLESLRDGYLVRVAHDLHASLFLDVMDIWKKAEQYQSEDILLHRFERGARVPRVMHPYRGPHRDIIYYSVFGPTVISTNENVHHILETRMIQILMPQTTRQFETDVTPEKGLIFRERLVAFRARHFGEKLPDILKPVLGRLGDILKPLVQTLGLVKPEKMASFLKLVVELEKERLAEKSETLEAQILKVVISLENRVQNGVLAVKEITDTLNQGKLVREQFTYEKIGWRLRAMGFRKTHLGETRLAAVIWDEKAIKRMKRAYGIEEPPEPPA